MRIGLDGIPLATPLTGIGHYTLELALALAHLSPSDEFELISTLPLSEATARQLQQHNLANLQTIRTRFEALRAYWWTLGLPLHIWRRGYTLYHGTNYDVPLWNRCPTVVTIHDLSLLLHPSTHEKRLVNRARRRLPVVARNARMIITPSESVRGEVCEQLSVRPEKVRVVPEAARSNFRQLPREQTIATKTRLGVEDEFVLFVGTIEPRKNLLTLVRAFEELLRTTALRPQLVIVGREGWLNDELFSYIKNSEFRRRVLLTGYVSEEDLVALYSSCRVSIYPSLYEGFGLPTLEAMACGAPVITSRIESIMEAVGDAARLIPPTETSALTRSMVELLENEDERQRLSTAGLERARQFSWEKTARATMEVYREALEQGNA
jgi:glycosyltransferase involved in cell wall biosynthesis